MNILEKVKVLIKEVKINFLNGVIFTFLFSISIADDFDTCIWIKADSMKSKKSIQEALLFAYENNFQKVFVQRRYRGDAFYNSDIVPKSSLIGKDFDPLSYAVELSNSLGLEIHAWVNVYILWSSNYEPQNKNHVYYKKKDWMEYNINGKSDFEIDLDVPQSSNWEGIFISPLHPEVNSYLINVYSEIVNKYDVYGLHLDYIRFQDDVYGYNKVGRKIFENKYKFDPLDIERDIISTKYGWSKTEIDSIKKIWVNYKLESINSLLIEIRDYINSSNKNIQLSAAVKSNPVLAKKKWSQDWALWINEELLDFAVVMNYTPDIINFGNSIEIIKEEIDDNYSNRIIMGIGIYNQDSNSIANQVYLSYLYKFGGVSFFSYDNRKDDFGWYDNIIKTLEGIK
ncbi:MAG: hypothetical protein CMG00_03085 [Candidatus Marinimicrobia bacterium]|nr:hypothetical protein [Candidatus Neomarinimicrobiota bacterium]